MGGHEWHTGCRVHASWVVGGCMRAGMCGVAVRPQAYTRALELGPGRVLSLVQAGALHYGQGAYREAGGAYNQ